MVRIDTSVRTAAAPFIFLNCRHICLLKHYAFLLFVFQFNVILNFYFYYLV